VEKPARGANDTPFSVRCSATLRCASTGGDFTAAGPS
jgi:hypothetical protein